MERLPAWDRVREPISFGIEDRPGPNPWEQDTPWCPSCKDHHSSHCEPVTREVAP